MIDAKAAIPLTVLSVMGIAVYALRKIYLIVFFWLSGWALPAA